MLIVTKRRKGFSLIELMVTLVLASALLLGVYKVYSSFVHSGFENLRKLYLDQELEDTMDLITNQLRRATNDITTDNSFVWDTGIALKINEPSSTGSVITPGNPGSFPTVNNGDIGPILGAYSTHGNGRVRITYYNGSGASATGTALVPFTNMPANKILQPGEWFVVDGSVTTISEGIRIFDPGTNDTGRCVLFSYDADKNGMIEEDEYRGFRLATVNSIGTIQHRTGGSDFTDCTTGIWSDVTDNKLVDITDLTFTLTKKDEAVNGGGTASRIEANVSITGELVDDNRVSKTLERKIYLRNDQYTPS